MQKNILFLLLVLFCFSMFCKKDSPNEPKKSLTEEEAQAIEAAHEQVSAISDSALTADDPITAFENILESVQQNPQIERAWTTSTGLFVKYKKGGVVSWLLESDIKPPYIPKKSIHQAPLAYITGVDNIVGNNKVCLMNQQYNDESRLFCRDIINRLEASFKEHGFEVDVKNVNMLDLDFFDSELDEYGTLYYITHGSFDGTNVWICTGELGDISLLTRTRYWDWYENQISVGIVEEVRNGVKTPVKYVNVSNVFIDENYKKSEFKNAFVYFTACQFFKSNVFGQAFYNKGVGATVGWDETNCKGKHIGENLVDFLLGGYSLSEAMDALPTESTIDFCRITDGANLTFYPTTGSDIRLVEPPDYPAILLNSPENGLNYNYRIIGIEGKIENATGIKYGTVEVNGITVRLETIGLDFSQRIVINKGANSIKINCIAILEDGRTATLTKEIIVYGDFPELDLFTELRWNTNYSDVDLHLLPPGKDLYDLFTTSDCYFSNMSPYWGGTLDIDDVEGYGPEHIEIPKSQFDGVYRLFVHYWDDDGIAYSSGATSAFVDVAVQNEAFHKFGPYILQHSYKGYNEVGNIGDIYEVCTIEFPSGKITPVNQYHNIQQTTGLFTNVKSITK